MKYNFIRREIGTNNCKKISTFETESEIFQTCLISNNGIMLLQKNLPIISYISINGKFTEEWMGKKTVNKIQNGSTDCIRLISPCSITHDNTNAYVTEENGLSIRRFDLENKYMSTYTGNNYKMRIEKYLSKNNNESIINSCVCNNAVVLSNNLANRCFASRQGALQDIIGDGKRRFSVCSIYENSSINNPMGICNDKGFIYVSDTGNSCVRKIDLSKKYISVFSGNPVKEKSYLKSPTILKINKGILYVFDENSIKVTGTINDKIGNIYQSDSIISYEVDDQRKLYLIERHD